MNKPTPRTPGPAPRSSYIVIGMAPPEFFGAKVGESPDFYAPLNAAGLPTQDYWQPQWVTILARLKPERLYRASAGELSSLSCKKWKRPRRCRKSSAKKISLTCS